MSVDRFEWVASRHVEFDADPLGREFEVQHIKVRRTAPKRGLQKLLVEEAEHGHWELKRLRRYRDGSSEVWLRRRVIRVRSTLTVA